MKHLLIRFLAVTGFGFICSPVHSQPNFQEQYEIPPKYQAEPNEDKAALHIGTVPYMPRQAHRSGFCCLRIDVSASGDVVDLRAPYCSDELFRKPSISAAKYWKFKPAFSEGKTLSVSNQRHTMKFRLVDEEGKFIPDREGLMSHDPRDSASIEKLCDGLSIS